MRRFSIFVLFFLLLMPLVMGVSNLTLLVNATTYNTSVDISSPIQNKTYFTNDIPLSFNYSTDIINSSEYGESRGVVLVYSLDGEVVFDMFGQAHLGGMTTRIGQFYEPVPSDYTLSIDVPNGNHSVIVMVTFWFMREGQLISIRRLSQTINFTVSAEPQIPEFTSIYIRSDGSVEGTDKLQRNGNIYTFTDNINAEITVEIDDIVIDGADYSLQGNGEGIGIHVPNNGNLEIKNTKIQGFKFAIYFDYYSKNSNIISGNTLTNNTHYGVYIYSSNNRIFGNYLENSGTGIQLVESYNNTIFQNKIIENEEGIGFGSGGGYSTIFHNLIADNDYAFTFWANSQNTIYGNNLINNTNQVHVWSSSNNWDYQSMGNYWSDYNGTDSNGDGIGDTPYVISTSPEDYGDADNYPLMKPVNDNIIPEFPSWAILPLLIVGTLVGVIIRNKIRKNELE
jgi:parallel beta-helix repeat protein